MSACASSGSLANPTGGLTKGAYVLQIRLQETDEFAGSTIQNADIRYAINAVEVIGKPEHSPLIANTAETTSSHTFIPGFVPTAQELGNLLTSDRNSISVAGNLTAAGEVDLYRFEINYDLIQSIAGVSDGAKSFATMFQINYADGLARPDTTLSIYDANGTLLLTGLDSDIADSLQRPNAGADFTNWGARVVWHAGSHDRSGADAGRCAWWHGGLLCRGDIGPHAAAGVDGHPGTKPAEPVDSPGAGRLDSASGRGSHWFQRRPDGRGLRRRFFPAARRRS